MKTVLSSVHRHIKHHHKKYLFGIFGGFAVAKLFLLVIGLSVVQHSAMTNAELASGCITTGQYYTGAYQTGGYLTGQELTGWITINCTTIPWYFTGGTLNESGIMIDQIRIEASQTWCEFTGQELTWGYLTWWYLTWWYRTWGYITWCIQEQTGTNQTWTNQTGTNQTGTTQTWTNQTGTNQTGTIQQQTFLLSWNNVCESGDILWSTIMSWLSFRNIFSFSWMHLILEVCIVSNNRDCIISSAILERKISSYIQDNILELIHAYILDINSDYLQLDRLWYTKHLPLL